MASAITVFPWKSEYAVNVGIIDIQHHRLVSLIDQLQQAMQTGEGVASLQEVFRELDSYILFHLNTEEEAMAFHDYPLCAAHTADHLRLTRHTSQLVKEHEGTYDVSVEVLVFLMDWLDKHIMSWDKLLGEFLNSKKVC